MVRPKKVLVTGATGFLGSRIVRGLLSHKHQVVALRRSHSSPHYLAPWAEQLTWVDLHKEPVETLFSSHSDVDVVIHTATSYGRNGESEADIDEANIHFPLAILSGALSSGVSMFINTDTSLSAQASHYAASKKSFLKSAKKRCEGGPIRLVNMVLEQVFGPGDGASKFTSYVISGCHNNVSELALTEGQQQRDFIYIDDAVDAFMRVIEADVSAPYQEYPLGLGTTVTIRDFVEMVKRITGADTRLCFGAVPYRTNEVMMSRADTAPLNALGWQPQIDLEEAIRRTAEQGGSS